MKTSFGLLLFATLLSCGEQEIDTKAEAEKLMQASREWNAAAQKNDVEKVISYWTDDALLMSQGEAALSGKTAIRQMVQESFKIPGFNIKWEPQSAFVSKSGDLGYLIEKSQITVNDSTGKPITTHFKAVTIWKKQSDGSWKNAVDISNTEPVTSN